MQSNGHKDRSIRFGPFELKLKSGELCRDGATVKLPPQPFKVLSLLAENAGQLVTREEIQQQVWGSDTFVDFDKGLNFCIKQIREALGDNAQSPLYIETLPRRGYRFIAPVENFATTASTINPASHELETIFRAVKGSDRQAAPHISTPRGRHCFSAVTAPGDLSLVATLCPSNKSACRKDHAGCFAF